MIFLCLRKNDLTICARVSKTWNAIGTPILWRKISVTTSKQFRRFATGAAQQAVVKNGEHIRELDIEYLSLLDLFAIPIYDPLMSVDTQLLAPICGRCAPRVQHLMTIWKWMTW